MTSRKNAWKIISEKRKTSFSRVPRRESVLSMSGEHGLVS